MAAGEARPIADDDEREPARRALVPLSGRTIEPGAPRAEADGPAEGAAPAVPEARAVADARAAPDARVTARALGLCVVEVLTGGREVDSIARWVTEDVQRHLLQRAALAARARSLGERSRARPALQVGSVVVCEPAPGVAEAAVVVHTRSHARAVALRLELRQGRWRATAVGVL
ncbi:Rv3235 family protein [Curtobacterium caseinilyticum]|uniref:Rv3235 family protein n=1 Tax=Curtobacterium caseinilyticum TaxID=3055137 RepID=A0ABT7TV32_9MICO|nr:Rv3235 family protein [Curtobacterium caseinilyticum]MDM7892772.1 Rv3235 family protein [Curtobacterium caseinilyticum]